MEVETLTPQLSDYFKQKREVAFAYLFGSIVKGTAHAESDIDIGVYFMPKTRALEYESEERYPTESEIANDLERLLGRRVEMVVLNRAPVTLLDAVLHEGRLLFYRDNNLLARVRAATEDLAEDFRQFTADFIRIKERSKSLTPNDRNRLERIVDFLQDQMSDFETFASVTQKQYEQDRSIKRNLERWAELLAVASVDIAKILLASAKRPLPRTYKTIVAELAFLSDFDEAVAKLLAEFSDLRNLLAHEYLDLRFTLLERFVKTGASAYIYLIKFAKKTLQSGD